MISVDLIIQTLISGMLIGGIYASLALGANLLIGILRVLPLAHGGITMLGMFIVYWLFILYGLSPLLSLPVSFLILFILGILIGKTLFLRLIDDPDALNLFVLATYGLLQVVVNGAQLIWSGDYRKLPVSYTDFRYGKVSVSGEYLIGFALSIVLCIALHVFLVKTKTGKAIRAVSQDSEAAASLGININHMRLITIGLSFGLAGFAGVIFALIYYIFPYVGVGLTMIAVIVCVLGGLGNYLGTIFGALIIGLAQSVSYFFIPYGLKDAVGFLIFIFVLMFRPQGIFGK